MQKTQHYEASRSGVLRITFQYVEFFNMCNAHRLKHNNLWLSDARTFHCLQFVSYHNFSSSIYINTNISFSGQICSDTRRLSLATVHTSRYAKSFDVAFQSVSTVPKSITKEGRPSKQTHKIRERHNISLVSMFARLAFYYDEA